MKPVVIGPPSPEGSRKVWVKGQMIATARSLHDLPAIMQNAGFGNRDELDIATSNDIHWEGGGPDSWAWV
jgi:hypothetical protein